MEHYFRPTAAAILIGILVACAVGLLLATAMHLVPWLRRAVYPLLWPRRRSRSPCWRRSCCCWLSFGLKPELFVIALVSFFSIVVTTLSGLATVDPQLVKLTRSFDGSRLMIFRHVEFPAALPGVFTGARIAVVWTGIAAMLAETSTGSTSGLGYLYETAQAQFLIPRAWATIVVLSLFTIALFTLLTLAERLALPWAYQPIGERRR